MLLLSSMFTTIQQRLFPVQEESLGELSDKHKALIGLTELAGIEKFIHPFRGKLMGRPRCKRQPIVVAFLAKAVWNDSTTRALLDRLSADSKLRRGEKLPMAPHQSVRYRERSTAERVMSNLKDNYGGRFVRVRGASKVMCHLMFGIVAMTARQLFRLLE